MIQLFCSLASMDSRKLVSGKTLGEERSGCPFYLDLAVFTYIMDVRTAS